MHNFRYLHAYGGRHKTSLIFCSQRVLWGGTDSLVIRHRQEITPQIIPYLVMPIVNVFIAKEKLEFGKKCQTLCDITGL